MIKVYRRFASARPTPQPCVPILMVRQSKKISLEMKKQTNKGTKTTTKRGKYLLPWIDRLCGRDLRKSWCQKERHFFHHSCTGPENNKITIRRCLYGKKVGPGLRGTLPSQLYRASIRKKTWAGLWWVAPLKGLKCQLAHALRDATWPG